MTVVFDASFLIPLLDEDAQLDDPLLRRKVNHLVTELHKTREVIVVPTPALSEYLAGAGAAGPKILQILTTNARFRVAPFDTTAAVEAAADLAAAKAAGDKKGGVDAPFQKIKFDRQIIAVARVMGCTRIFSNDPHFKTLVGMRGPEVVNFADLPEPPQDVQLKLQLDVAPEQPSEDAD
jgi:predicted nucleic acid-binding protein